MSVPDTNTFTLQDVVNELVPFVDSLVGCFAVAVDGYFDPAYKGSKDRQSNFRNYGTDLKWIYLEPYVENETGHVWAANDITNPPAGDQAAWDLVHDRAVGDGVIKNTDNLIKGAKRNKGGGNYDMFISRTFLSFNMTLIPNAITILSAKFVVRCTSQQGISMIGFFRITYNGTIETSDYRPGSNMFLFPFATKNNDDWVQGDSSTVKDISCAISTELDRINSGKESVIEVMISHYKDYEDSLPQTDHYVWIWRNGTEIGDYIWKPQLRLQYSGAHMLEIPVTLWEPGTPADQEHIYLVANEENSWLTIVSPGDTWLTVTAPTFGDGTRLVRINVSQNTGAPRNGTVTFDSDSADKVLTVNQAGVPSCTGSPDPYAAAYNDHDKQFFVVAYPDTNAWTASFVDTGDGTSWISFVGGNTGIGDGDFTVNIDDNNGPARSCDIKLVSDAASDYLIDVNQAAGGISGGILEIDNQSNNTDSTNIDVTPNTMDTTSSKIDTGDGTAWFNITSSLSQNGDFILSIILVGTPTENLSAQVKVDDDDSGIYKLVSVTYTYFA